MANRSYLYTSHPGDPNSKRDLSEWKSNPPLSHYLLVSSNPTPVKTVLWTVDEKIAIRGEAAGGKALFFQFLDWIAPQLLLRGMLESGSQANISTEIEAAKAALNRDDRQGEFYHLELGEIYDLSGYELAEMESACLRDVNSALAIAKEVRNLLETSGSSMADFEGYELKEVRKDWEQSLGLYFPGILYFHMGK